jgi:hypothetical protein
MPAARPIVVFLAGSALTLGVALAVIWLTGGDDGGVAGDTAVTTTADPGTVAPTTAPPAPSTTAAPALTTTPAVTVTAPVATVAPGSRCAGVESMTLPPGVELSGQPGNFDGPPEPTSIMDADSAFVFESAGQWYLGFSLEIGYLVYEPITVDGPPGFAPEVRVWNFAGDDGAWVKVERSMLGPEVYVWYYLDETCGVEDAGVAGEDPLQWLDWAGANHTQAFACTADGVFKTEAAESSGGLWELTDTYYEWTAPQGPGFLFGFADAVEVPASDPGVEAAGGIDCPG